MGQPFVRTNRSIQPFENTFTIFESLGQFMDCFEFAIECSRGRMFASMSLAVYVKLNC